MDKPNWERRTLGRTGFEVTAMGIGCAWLGHKDGETSPEVGVETVLAGLEAGMNLLDTSDDYRGGDSEGIVGQALEHWFGQGNRREDLILATKVTATQSKPDAFTYDGTMRSLELSLRELRVDYLDIFLVHDPVDLEPVLADDGAIVALRKAKEQGTIRAIGLGCRPHEFHRRCIETGEFDMSLTFHDYNLVVRTAEAGVLEHAVKEDVGVYNASINAALSSAQNAERAQRLTDWCRERDIDRAALNLQFCLREKRFASTLIGFSRPARVEQNLADYSATFDDSIWEELEQDLGSGG